MTNSRQLHNQIAHRLAALEKRVALEASSIVSS
jgi:hypothetical protein